MPADRIGGRPANSGSTVGGRRSGDPVPGRGAGAAGPVPPRAARRGGADQRGDGRPPPGHGAGLPHAFLEAAAPGYLTGDQWDALGEDWLEQALAYAAVPAKGGRGPLTRIRPRPTASRAPRSGPRDSGVQRAGGLGGMTAGPLYRLADYLDQHARQHRKDQIPPPEFWAAAAAHALPADQATLGHAADARGLYRDAAQLHKNAAHGSLSAALYLSHPPNCLRTDPHATHWAAAHTPLDDPGGVAILLGRLRAAGAGEQAAALLARDPAAHVSLDSPGGVARLLGSLRAAGAGGQAAALLARDPAAHAPRQPGRRGPPAGQPAGGGRGRAGRRAGQPRCRPRLPRSPGGVAHLLVRLAAASEQAAALASRVCLDSRAAWPSCWSGCGRRARAGRPPRWPAALPPTSPLKARAEWPTCWSGCGRRAGGQAAALLARDPAAHVSLDSPGGVAILLVRLREAGAGGQAAALASRGLPPTSPSTTRAAWPTCWTNCGRRARSGRRTTRRRPRLRRRPGRRGRPAGQPAGGGRGRAGRRAGQPTARSRHVRTVPQAAGHSGPVPVRPGGWG